MGSEMCIRDRDVTLNQVITKDQIEAGKLTFQGAANAEGSSYDTVKFAVVNANGEDSTPNTLTFDVTAVEDEATGSVTFTTNASGNAVQEGATVTADVSGLSAVSSIAVNVASVPVGKSSTLAIAPIVFSVTVVPPLLSSVVTLTNKCLPFNVPSAGIA